ncbi:hypothetical protein [Maribacter sp. 2-571]|uniref:hypothetical protein n=1 Tax=Maribacter sp. 2-571 TaxID=3417569 RepID=UPI003D3520D0
MKKHIVLFLLIVLTFSLQFCKSQTKETVDCNVFNAKYIEYALKGVKDSALLSINNAINCDPKNKFYHSAKVNFLIDQGQWTEALLATEQIDAKDDYTLNLLNGVLLLRAKKENADIELKKTFDSLKQDADYSSDEINKNIYLIALYNYFVNKDVGLQELSKLREKRKGKASNDMIDFLENNISNLSKEEVLYKFFNIR